MLCETPTVIEGHAFTTGKITRNSIERILPNSFVDYSSKEVAGCDYGHYTAAELQGKIVPDQHVHEHATCFNIRGKGLVVISSCGHVGIVNSVRQAQEVSGVKKVHAIVGGFHLGPGAGRLPQAGGRRGQEAGARRADPDALQRLELPARGARSRCRTTSSTPRPAAS